MFANDVIGSGTRAFTATKDTMRSILGFDAALILSPAQQVEFIMSCEQNISHCIVL